MTTNFTSFVENLYAMPASSCRPHTALVLGGGMGGLLTAALLARHGFKVTVLEQNHVVGGGLQCFDRYGCRFPTGLHVFGGCEPGGLLLRLFQDLGIADQLHICPTDAHCQEEVHVLADGVTCRIPRGRDGFIEAFSHYFPAERDGIVRFVDTLVAMVDDEMAAFADGLRNGGDFSKFLALSVSDAFPQRLCDLIASCVSDHRLQRLLAYLNPLYAGKEGHTPSLLHASVAVQQINGSFRFIEGTQQLADALCGVVTSSGGRVLTHHKVTQIHTSDYNISDVSTSDGACFDADVYVSDLHPQALSALVDGKAFSPFARRRIAELPNTNSVFSLFVKFAKGRFPFVNHAVYCYQDYESIWWDGDDDEVRSVVFYTMPDADGGQWSQSMVVHCPMSLGSVAAWSQTTVGRRGADYEAWKRGYAEKVFAFVERFYPGLRAAVEAYETASPLTLRDYFGNPGGSLYGIRKDADKGMLSHFSVRTKLSNLFLTGQNISFHGLYGVSMTALVTAKYAVDSIRPPLVAEHL